MPEPEGELNPAAKRSINEALADALALPGADAFEQPPGEEVVPLPQKKREGEGVSFQAVGRSAVTSVADLEQDYKHKLLELQELENRRALAKAWKLFHADGSLMGEYAPLAGEATTPDTVDAIWWLALPRAQAMWELGLDKGDDATYSRIRRDIECMAAVVINRMLQTRTAVPMIIRRKKRRFNSALFAGGKLKRLKGINPLDYPGMDVSPRNKASKADTADDSPAEQ